MIEAFNASVRRECLSEHYFSTVAESQVVLGTFRDEYNNHRPHSSLGQQTPGEFYAGTRTTTDRGALLNESLNGSVLGCRPGGRSLARERRYPSRWRAMSAGGHGTP